MHPTVRSWLKKSMAELDEIYCSALSGEIPRGDTEGTAILAGSLLSQSVAAISRMWLWQGKVFDIFCPCGPSGILYNKITPLSLTYIIAKVYRGISWAGKPSSWTIPAPLSWPRRSATKSARSNRGCTWARSGGAGNRSSISPWNAPVNP